MKRIHSLIAVAAIAVLTSCSPAQIERVDQSSPIAPAAQMQEITVPAEAKATFEAVEAVTVEVAPVTAATPVEVVEVAAPVQPIAAAVVPAAPAEVVKTVVPVAPAPAAPKVVEVVPAAPVAPVLPAPVEYAPEPLCFQDEPCWDCKTMGNFCVNPKDAARTDK